jgi:hypothetical protein
MMSTRWLMVAVVFGALFMDAGSAEARRYGRGRRSGSGFSPAAILVGMGKFNQLTSQAAKNYEQAYSDALDNRLKTDQTYFQARRENSSGRAELAAQRPHYTPEQYAADNQARVAGRLSLTEWNAGLGVFVWPQGLAGDGFAYDRTRIEALFGARDAEPSAAGLGTANYREIKHAVAAMSDHLDGQIKEMAPNEYIPASKFLKKVEYEARFTRGEEIAAAK